MENNTTNPTNTPIDPAIQPETPHKHGATGAFIGSLIIILVIILGGVYLWNKILERSNPEANVESNALMADTGTELSDSDDTASIESDLNGSDFDNLDREMSDVDAEFEAN